MIDTNHCSKGRFEKKKMELFIKKIGWKISMNLSFLSQNGLKIIQNKETGV